MSHKKKLYLSSSEEEDEEDRYIPKKNFPKSAVFNIKTNDLPMVEDRN